MCITFEGAIAQISNSEVMDEDDNGMYFGGGT